MSTAGEPSSARGSITVEARGKVNLGLAVLARRGDGFHQIETLFARVLLADLLEVELLEQGAGVELLLAATPGTDLGLVPPGADNLAVKAAHAYLEAWSGLTGQPGPGLRIRLTKAIPVAAGLGGGSADAGAVLRALAELLPIGPSPATTPAGQLATQPAARPAAQPSDTVMRIAATLGSDVPFFASGLAAATATGRGERLKPAAVPRCELILAKPALGVSAAEAYRALVGFTPRLRPERSLEALAHGAKPGWSNALQPGVLRLHPEIREVLEALRRAGLRGVLMSGSGPTCFGLAAGPLEAAEVAAALAAQRSGWWVATTATG